jgi:aromatic-L-amino-acid decarboxylase
MNEDRPRPTPHTLDPSDWQEFRAQGHRMLDYLEHIRERPVWQPIPQPVRDMFHESLPIQPTDLATAHASFMRDVLPYAVGNAHPSFMGWVHGGGTPVGMLAEMLAAGLNANLGGRDRRYVRRESPPVVSVSLLTLRPAPIVVLPRRWILPVSAWLLCASFQ